MPRFLSPDHEAGDEGTVGGYHAVHGRPPALAGPDGFAYSVEATASATGDAHAPWGGFLLFLRWRRVGAQGVEGHLESDFLVRAATEDAALDAVRATTLEAAQLLLDSMVRERNAGGQAPQRRWWDVMQEEGDDDD